jgi:hypothetical protein
MDRIFWAETPTLTGLHPCDPTANELREALVTKVPQALKPLEDYLNVLKPYESWLKLDVADVTPRHNVRHAFLE